MKKFFIIFITILLIAGVGVFVYLRLIGVEDTWIQDKETGAWLRRGNPKGAAPVVAVRDCYVRRGSQYVQAVAQCVPVLCAVDEVCINDLLDTFESLRNRSTGDEFTESHTIPIDTPSPVNIENVRESNSGEAAVVPQEEPVLSTEGVPEPSVQVPAVSSSVRLSLPSANAVLTSPFTVQGDVRAEVSSVIVRVKGAEGGTIIEEALLTRSSVEGGWRSFKITLAYDFDHTKEGIVEVEALGASIMRVPVIFQ